MRDWRAPGFEPRRGRMFRVRTQSPIANRHALDSLCRDVSDTDRLLVIVDGLSVVKGAYMIAAMDPGTSLWDLTALSKYSQAAASARWSPRSSPPRTPSRGSTPPSLHGSRTGSPLAGPLGGPLVGETRLGSPFGKSRRPGSRDGVRPGSVGRPGSRDGCRPGSVGRPGSRDGGRPGSRPGSGMVGAFGTSSMGGGGAGLQWDVSMPPMGSTEDLATYDRVATLLGQMPSAMLFVSASPHALLIAQQAGWRTAYVPRLGATDHPRLNPNATRFVKKQTNGPGQPAGPRSVGLQHAEASLRKEAVFGSTHDSERRFSGNGSGSSGKWRRICTGGTGSSHTQSAKMGRRPRFHQRADYGRRARIASVTWL